uniref:F-box domain-containing protein n=1 Tax=Mycena chlorophos TaxID=658473 RepID=A0ABQ0L3E6_MYCCL|nr:predicted protein [Mycena chlorophos]
MRMQPIGDLDERVRPTRSLSSFSRRKRIHPRLDLSSTSVLDPEDCEYKTSICWESVLSNEQISALFAELAGVRALRSVRALALAKCGLLPRSAWSAFMAPFCEVKTLSIAGFPPPGLFRALLDESQSAARPRFLRSIDSLMLHNVDFDADGYGGIPLLAGACFVDLVVRLIDTRREACSEAGKLRVKLDSCGPIALGEIERLRCLVDEFRWDGWGCV